jgi:chaperonin GroEL
MLSSGDGTTTTAILIQALINKGYELIEEGISFYDLSRAFDKALLDVKKYLKSNSINVETNEELLKDIASISSNDEKIGSFLYDLIKEIGIYGDIDVRTSMLNETSIEKHFGMKLNQG